MTSTTLLSLCLLAVISPAAANAASPVAYVYVAEDATWVTATQPYYSSSPITVFSAASNGKLIQVKGSPFTLEPAETMVGTNGTHAITLDNTPGNPYLRSYDVSSGGIPGKEVSKIDLHTWCYFGAAGAELDQTGADVYVLIEQHCGGEILNFTLSKTGALTFKGIATNTKLIGPPPAITGNNKFAYAPYDIESSDDDCGVDKLSALNRESNGSLEGMAFSETDPTPPPGGYQFYQNSVATGGTHHLAAVVFYWGNGCDSSLDAGPLQLASYTVGSQGDLVSTNTWENMPVLPNIYIGPMALNPAGSILAVAEGTGTQFYHFDGADPITPIGEIIGISGQISAMAWDKDNHLYALNTSGKLHVYTATTTSVVESPGSPYAGIPYCAGPGYCPQSLIVRVP